MQTRTESNAMTESHMHEHADLWARYWAGEREAYEELVEAYLPLVKITVGRMSLTIPAYVSREDLYSAGTMGLLSAVERYDATREAKFTTYAITRIRGAILDELRAHDLLGRVTRERVTRIQAAENRLHNEGRALTPEEVALEAGLSLDEYWDAEMGALATHQLRLSEVTEDGEHTLEDLIESTRQEEPGHAIELEEVIELVQDLLTDKEKLLVVLYYKEGLTLKEIGTILQVSESRVCQMHTAMAVRIRKKLETRGILF
jgi:RNA polymerase sigma factor for flagellar operon FliA